MTTRLGDDVLIRVGISKVWAKVLEMYGAGGTERYVVELGDGSTCTVLACETERVSPSITLDELIDGLRHYLSLVGQRRSVYQEQRRRLTPTDYLRVTLLNLQEIQRRQEREGIMMTKEELGG